jgi:hypothetical protein
MEDNIRLNLMQINNNQSQPKTHTTIYVPRWQYSRNFEQLQRCSVVVKALRYKPEGRGFDTHEVIF